MPADFLELAEVCKLMSVTLVVWCCAVAELGAVLGEKAARGVQRDLRFIIGATESRLKK